MEVRDLNSGFHACAGSTLPAISPAPDFCMPSICLWGQDKSLILGSVDVFCTIPKRGLVCVIGLRVLSFGDHLELSDGYRVF